MRLYCIITSGTFCGGSTRSEAAPARTARRVIAGSKVIHKSKSPTSATTVAETSQIGAAYPGAAFTQSAIDCATSHPLAATTANAQAHALALTQGLFANTPIRAGLLVKWIS